MRADDNVIIDKDYRTMDPKASSCNYKVVANFFPLAAAGICLLLTVIFYKSHETVVSVQIKTSTKLYIGKIGGKDQWVNGTQSSSTGRGFRGIPYAKAGRWENPLPADPWEPSVLDARRDRASCLRPQSNRPDDFMSENCQHLNVFTPIPMEDNDESTGELLSPVLVWFHGGSYTMGAGSDTTPELVRDLVMSLRFIVVTINYRLGVFGFLGSKKLRPKGGEGNWGGPSTGNFGTLDQQMAMKWVHERISYFNGDVTKITVVGWSAGAASISVHLSMPSSEKYFQNGIMMSGGFSDWAAQPLEDAEKDYQLILTALDCAGYAECQEVGPPCECLTQQSAANLVRAQVANGITWAPTVDGTALPVHPQTAIREGLVHKGKAIIIGSTLEDACVDLGQDATDENFYEFLGIRFPWLDEEAIKKAYALYINNNTEETLYQKRFRAMHEGYSEAYWSARHSVSDSGMTCKARQAAHLWKKKTGANAYWYLWERGPSTGIKDTSYRHGSWAKKPLHIGGCWPCAGATHGSDQHYLFSTFQAVNTNNKDADLSRVYQTFFRDFTVSGNPNNWLAGFSLTDHGDEAWKTAEHGGMRFAAGSIHFEPELHKTQCEFWEEQKKWSY